MSIPTLQIRSRMLSVRLSLEEYEQLKQLSSLFGARTLSDLARKALQSLLGNPCNLPPENIGTNLSDLGKRLTFLDRKVERLSQLLGEKTPSVLLDFPE